MREYEAILDWLTSRQFFLAVLPPSTNDRTCSADEHTCTHRVNTLIVLFNVTLLILLFCQSLCTWLLQCPSAPGWLYIVSIVCIVNIKLCQLNRHSVGSTASWNKPVDVCTQFSFDPSDSCWHIWHKPKSIDLMNVCQPTNTAIPRNMLLVWLKSLHPV